MFCITAYCILLLHATLLVMYLIFLYCIIDVGLVKHLLDANRWCSIVTKNVRGQPFLPVNAIVCSSCSSILLPEYIIFVIIIFLVSNWKNFRHFLFYYLYLIKLFPGTIDFSFLACQGEMSERTIFISLFYS